MSNSVTLVKEPSAARGSTFLGWVVLGGILAAYPAQAVWYAITGSEPYPALAQPAFKSVPDAEGVLDGKTIFVSAVRSDGSAVHVDADDLFPNTGNQAPYVIESIIRHPDLDRQFRHRLLTRLAGVVPAGTVAYLKIESETREYRLRENRVYPISKTQTTIIDLRSAGHYAP